MGEGGTPYLVLTQRSSTLRRVASNRHVSVTCCRAMVTLSGNLPADGKDCQPLLETWSAFVLRYPDKTGKFPCGTWPKNTLTVPTLLQILHTLY